MTNTPIEALCFDLDGVLTPTVDIHKAAWRDTVSTAFDALGVAPYTEDDYFTFIDGKPRKQGVLSVLRSRGLVLPDAEMDRLAAEKDDAFLSVLNRDGISPYPGSLRFLTAVVDAGYKVALVSSSGNARHVLAASGLDRFFSVVVDGLVVIRDGMRGKPHPDAYLHAAELLTVYPSRAAVVEDAVSGVEAGHRGGFHEVIGVDRGVGAQALIAAGATRVVDDLDDLIADFVTAKAA